MTTIQDAYRVLDLDEDASLGEVLARYQEIVSGNERRLDGRRRTNLPAVHHSFKLILSRIGPFEEDEEDEDDFYSDCYYSPPDYFEDTDPLRETKFCRQRQRDEGYTTNTNSAAVAASANSLVKEEEDEKQETKKTDAKKKKKKKKKKKSKSTPLNVNNNITEECNENESSDDTDGEGLDLNSAFAKAAKKEEREKAAVGKENKGDSNKQKAAGRPAPSLPGAGAGDPGDERKIQAEMYAAEGNKRAKQGDFQDAVRVFTQAIQMDPSDHRFLGNRSFCYERLKQYGKALKDAERAIQINSNWPKGFYRKGRALLGQMKYEEAEEAFRHVLKLDKNVNECYRELEKIKICRLMSMGFSKDQSRSAIRRYKTEEAALDALVRGDVRDSPDDSSDSDDDTGQPVAGRGPVDPKEDPSNLEGLKSLWVGNIMQTVSERDIYTLFARHGAVTSVRLLPDRFCAFVNFGDKKGASLAMQHLQGVEFHGNRLKIKFPDNPIEQNGQQKVVLGKKPGPAGAPAAAGGKTKLSGPVGDGECFYWRTSECAYGLACKYKHIPANKGIDKKPWRR